MNNLKKIRGKHEISQEELARKIGVTKQIISISEVGKISGKSALKIAKVLDENVFDILGFDAFVVLPETVEDIEALKRTLDELCLVVKETKS